MVEKLKNDECREYLHLVMLENILSIVSLLTVFSECSMSLSKTSVARIVDEGRIENLIGQLRGFGKE